VGQHIGRKRKLNKTKKRPYEPTRLIYLHVKKRAAHEHERLEIHKDRQLQNEKFKIFTVFQFFDAVQLSSTANMLKLKHIKLFAVEYVEGSRAFYVTLLN